MELTKELRHWRSRVDLWWSGVMRDRRAQQEQRAARVREQYVAYQERQAKMASGELALPKGWHQKPDDPPGYLRWWNGSKWTEHTQQSQRAQSESRRGQSDGLVIAGWVCFVAGVFILIGFLASFIIGIILAAKGRAGHGTALIVLSLVGPLITLAVVGAYLFG